MPLWSHPARYCEVRALFTEGRIRNGRHTASRALDVGRALARLGAARGVTHFERFGYVERNGQLNLAVPLGRWTVSSQPHEELLDDLDTWLGKLRAFARDKVAPGGLSSAARLVDEAILAVLRSGGDPRRWQALLVGLGRAEGALLQSPNKTGDAQRGLHPLPPLRAGWLRAADDGSREFRLAMALAAQDVPFRKDGSEVFSNLRSHWMPTDRSHAPARAFGIRSAAHFATDAGGLAKDPEVVCHGELLERDCLALIRRRLQIAPSLKARGLGLNGAPGAEASLSDVGAFLVGDIDDAKILALARPLMAIAWWDGELPDRPRQEKAPIDVAYSITRLVHLSTPLRRGRDEVPIRLDAEPFARLAAGDLSAAVTLCLRRLAASGLSSVVRGVVGDARFARRIAASLAFPISARDAQRCADLVTKPYEPKEHNHAD